MAYRTDLIDALHAAGEKLNQTKCSEESRGIFKIKGDVPTEYFPITVFSYPEYVRTS